jgi:hypothetical protein
MLDDWIGIFQRNNMNLSHVFIKNKKNKFSNINFIYYYKKNLNEFNLQKYEKPFLKIIDNFI